MIAWYINDVNITFLLIFALFVQETLFAHYTIFKALESGWSWWAINITWTLITVFHMYVPYLLGKHLVNNAKGGRVKNFINKLKLKYNFRKKIKSRFFLISLGLVNFVYINTFVLGVLQVKDRLVFYYVFLGDLIWYVLVATASQYGVNILSDFQTFTFAVIIFVVISSVIKTLFKHLSNK